MIRSRRRAQSAEFEDALAYARRCIRDNGGTIPKLSSKAQARVARMMGLKATAYGWETRRNPEELAADLERFGIDPQTWKVKRGEEEKFYAWFDPLEKEEKEQAQHTKRRLALEAAGKSDLLHHPRRPAPYAAVDELENSLARDWRRERDEEEAHQQRKMYQEGLLNASRSRFR